MSLKSKVSIFFAMLLLVFPFVQNTSASAAIKAQASPKLQIVSQPASEYKKGDRISFTVGSPNYKGRVQYRVVLYNGTTKKTSELWNTPASGYYYTSWQPNGDYNFTINWTVSDMEPGAYNLTVLVRRSGEKTSYDSFVKTNTFWIKEDIKINSIDNIEAQVKQGENFNLPGTLKALMSDDSIKEVEVVWNASAVDTRKIGIYTFEGTVAGYDKKISLTLTVSQAEFGNTEGNIINSGIVASKDGWIYYMNLSDGGKLYKKKLDDTGKVKLSDYISDDINVVGDWVYCRGIDDKGDVFIYKVKTNGEQLTKLNEDQCTDLIVTGDWIYYINQSSNSKIYRIRTDGSEKTKLNDDKAGVFAISENSIYFTNSDDKFHLYKMDIDGGQSTKLNEDLTLFFDIEKDQIYYVTLNETPSGDIYSELYRTKLDGTEKTKVNESRSEFFTINVVDEWIYYTNASEELSLYKIKIDGTQRTKLTDESALYINIIGDWIYYAYAEDNGDDSLNTEMHFIKTDGSGNGIMQ